MFNSSSAEDCFYKNAQKISTFFFLHIIISFIFIYCPFAHAKPKYKKLNKFSIINIRKKKTNKMKAKGKDFFRQRFLSKCIRSFV